MNFGAHYFIFFLAFANGLYGDETDELLSVIVVYRHGDRTPLSFYPNDPYINNTWSEGQKQGKIRHHELGQWFRNRYNGFLSEDYSKDDIQVYSTDKDRTLQSAASNLAGLYPPKGTEIWNSDIHWQPIPIHPVPIEILNELFLCAKFDLLWLQLMISEPYTTINEENKELYEYLTNNSGALNFAVPTASVLRDTLFVEANNNLILPEWTEGVYPEKLDPIDGMMFASYAYTEDLARLSSGPFLYNVIQHFEKVTNNEAVAKFLMYSGHDSNVASILGGLGAFDPHSPPFASTVIFELRRKNDVNYVNVLYKNSTEPLPMLVKDCDFNCELGSFKSKLENVTINFLDWAKECYIPDVSQNFMDKARKLLLR